MSDKHLVRPGWSRNWRACESDVNPARDRMHKGLADYQREEEISIANAIKAEFPSMTRSECLREADRILRKRG